MPQASAGTVLTSSAQVGADVILTGNIKNGEIVNADLSASAAIDATKVQALNVGVNGGVIPSTGIVNAHLSGTAGITDANLAQITTAAKVSGAALTLLGNIPSGAGVIPVANVPGTSRKNGIFSMDLAGGSGTQNVAHGLGRVPIKVKITAFCAFGAAGEKSESIGVYDGTTTSSLHNNDGGTLGNVAYSNANIIDIFVSGGGERSATVTVDATNIILAVTKGGTPTGTVYLFFEAE